MKLPMGVVIPGPDYRKLSEPIYGAIAKGIRRHAMTFLAGLKRLEN
jgi:hypothetical protein